MEPWCPTLPRAARSPAPCPLHSCGPETMQEAGNAGLRGAVVLGPSGPRHLRVPRESPQRRKLQGGFRFPQRK